MFTGSSEGAVLAMAATGGAITEGYVSGFDLNMRKVYPELVKRYGDQGAEFIGMIMAMGWDSTSDVQTIEHFEDDWIWDNFKATCTTGGAGVAVAVTVDASSMDEDGNFFPGVKDIIEFPNRDSNGDPIQGYITSITGAALTVKPLKAAWAIPTLSTATELIVITNGNSEGSGQPGPKRRGAYKYTNKFAIGKASVEVTGSEMTDRSWIQEYDGKSVNSWYDIATNMDLDYSMMQNIQGGFLGGQEIDNSVNDPDNDKAVKWTKGLFPTVNEVGIQHPYSTFGVADFDEIERQLSRVYAGTYTCAMLGIEVDIAVENALKTYFNFTNIDFITKQGNQMFFKGDEGLSASVGFSYFQKAKRNFALKRFSTLHNPKTYGAGGFDYVNRALMFPLRSNNIDVKTKKAIPAIRVVYKALNGYNRKMEVFQTGSANAAKWGVTNDVDNRLFHQRCEYGFEGFACNQMVNIYKP